MTAGKVSVLIPTYNHLEFVAETLESALSQTYPDVDIIVSDDGSTDGTPDLVEDYAARHPDKVTLLRSERNAGLAANFNRALDARTGEFYAWLAGDDVMLPERVARQVERLRASPDAAGCVSDAEVFESDTGRVLGRFSEMYNGRRRLREGGVELWLRPGYYVLPSTFLIRSSAASPHGYDPRLRHANELVNDVEVFRQGRCVAVQDVLVRYRRHPGSVTAAPSLTPAGLEDNLMALAVVEARYPELAGLVRRRRTSLLLTEGTGHRARGDMAGMRRYLGAAIRDGGLLNTLRVAGAHLAVALGRRRLGARRPA